MILIKSVEKFSDVVCENCTSYNEGRCYQDLPSIPTDSSNKCGKGHWLLNGEIINYRHCCFELLPFEFVNSVDDLVCKNCDYYDLARGECHYYRENIYKSAANNWCNTGEWFYRDDDDEIILGSLSAAYEKIIKGKDIEKSISKNKRLIKTIEVFADVTCQNCISFNQGRCCYTLPTIPVGVDDKCNEGQWRHPGQNLYGISISSVPDRLVKDIKDLKCGECIFYNPIKEECHYRRQNVYKSGPDNWCDNGEWLYEDENHEVNRASLGFLYSKMMEGKDTHEK